MNIQSEFRDVNKPVNIELPPEALEAKEWHDPDSDTTSYVRVNGNIAFSAGGRLFLIHSDGAANI